ncbi:MAG: replication initiator protein A, partial [Chloroflexota bacterium]
MLAIAEMNLEEYPAFRLGRRSKRPELRYTRSRAEPDGRTLEQLWIVRGAEGLGLPGPFEQDLYVALLVLFTEQGLPADGRIRFTRNRLAQVMGCSNSGRGYELLEQGLSRLAGATIHTEHAFYRPAAVGDNGERSGPAERLSLDFHILEEVRVYERRSIVEEAPAPSTGDARPRVERARPLELAVARLGQPLVQSYERRYTKGLDATFYFSLERPLAKRLYRYLDKVRNGRGSFEIGLLGLADVLGLEYRYPSDIKDGLSDAHAEL